MDQQEQLEKITELTREMFHAYHKGDFQPWFSHMCSECVYIGNGDPILYGRSAIQNHFKKYIGIRTEVLQEEFHPILLGTDAACVYGQFIIGSIDTPFSTITHFTILYRIKKDKLSIVHHHNSYEHMQQDEASGNTLLHRDTDTMQFIRDLLLHKNGGNRLAVKSGTQTIYLNSNAILYIQSLGKKTEFICIDRNISCNSSIGELRKELPDIFYPLHRSYIINMRYITAIRRFEVELLYQTVVPIPASNYMQVKEDLQDYLINRKQKDDW